MENAQLEISTDLRIFMDKFDPIKFKVFTRGIEIRGINNIHNNIVEAKAIIERLELKLVVLHNAEMLSYKGFEVNNI